MHNSDNPEQQALSKYSETWRREKSRHGKEMEKLWEERDWRLLASHVQNGRGAISPPFNYILQYHCSTEFFTNLTEPNLVSLSERMTGIADRLVWGSSDCLSASASWMLVMSTLWNVPRSLLKIWLGVFFRSWNSKQNRFPLCHQVFLW